MNWNDYLAENVGEDGRHRDFPEWGPIDGEGYVWRMARSDGLFTAHKWDSPCATWQGAMEESMELGDKYIPLGTPEAEWPAGMLNPNTAGGITFAPLRKIEEDEEA